MSRKRIVVLGSGGSIGENTLRVIAHHSDRFELVGLGVQKNTTRLLEQAREFGVQQVAVADVEAAAECKRIVEPSIIVGAGPEAMAELAALPEADMVVCAVVGMAGLAPVLAALDQGTDVALATKEVMVAAGELVNGVARRTGAKLVPVDSEHNAIFQCLEGRDPDSVKRLIVTASGGPFLKQPDLDFKTVTVEQALNHPRWDMGAKISIDSATMMNKGLELIEARWLFDIELDRIDVIIHPESIIHSMVEFLDGSILAQLSPTDMRFAIQYALSYPRRLESSIEGLDLVEMAQLNFAAPDPERFRFLALAREASHAGGTLPAVLNAANEVAVQRFLDKDLSFSGIWETVEGVMNQHNNNQNPDLEAIVEADRWARGAAS